MAEYFLSPHFGIYCAIHGLQQMPMCGYYCDCYWCVVDLMASNDHFKQCMDQLVAEFKETTEFQLFQEHNQKGRSVCKEDV
jgi:hypothetical protein